MHTLIGSTICDLIRNILLNALFSAKCNNQLIIDEQKVFRGFVRMDWTTLDYQLTIATIAGKERNTSVVVVGGRVVVAPSNCSRIASSRSGIVVVTTALVSLEHFRSRFICVKLTWCQWKPFTRNYDVDKTMSPRRIAAGPPTAYRPMLVECESVPVVRQILQGSDANPLKRPILRITTVRQ